MMILLLKNFLKIILKCLLIQILRKIQKLKLLTKKMSKKESKNRIININVFITNTVNNVGVNNMKYINPKIKNIVFNAIKTNKEGVKNSVKSINNIIRRIKKCVLNVRIFYIKKANIKRKFE